MKKCCFIVILLFGYLLWPTTAIACKNDKKMTCCGAEMKNNVCKMKCCQEKSDEKSTTKPIKSCDGKCGKNTCQAQSISFSAILPVSTEINYTSFFVLVKKSSFYNYNTNPTSGFHSIWSPPNIG